MILIGLGANLPSPAGPPLETLKAALSALARNGATPRAVSRFYESMAWPDPSDPSFVNAVARVETALAPAALLARLKEIERSFGRIEARANAPRPLDLDVLDYDARVEAGPPILPHPRMESRAFVLVPLRDVAPAWRHPVSGRSVAQLVAALPKGEVALKPIA
jgi:2-amino-4-hydroxy-6-hydroxymethyldihydropteridine diphosphokinase